MADVSDEQLRAELKELTGKDAGPVMSSTKPALIKKLMRLRKEQNGNEKPAAKPSLSPKKPKNLKAAKNNNTSQATTTASANFGFSSDEDRDWDTDTRANVSKEVKKKVTSARRSTSAKQVSHSSRNSVGRAQQSRTINGGGPSKSMSAMSKQTKQQMEKMSNDEIQQQLYDITGQRFPISDTTRTSLVKKLTNLLGGGDSASANVSLPRSGRVPMETQFSEDGETDEEMMDCDPSPEVSTSIVRPVMVSQSVNTSSFLDVTLPDPPDDDPDCIVMPAPSRRSVLTKHSDTRITSSSQDVDSPDLHVPSQLPSPNLSSTRRSFVPSSGVVRDPVRPRPLPHSPPRSTFARRPLRTSPTNFVHLNQDVTPKPTTRLSGLANHFGTSQAVQSTRPDYSTRYSTGGGGSIDPNPKKDEAGKDVGTRMQGKGKPSSSFYSKAVLWLLLIFLVIVAGGYIYQKSSSPVPLEKIFDPTDEYVSLLSTEDKSDSHKYFTAGQLKDAHLLVQALKPYLSDHAGWFECGKQKFDKRRVSKADAERTMMDIHGPETKYVWDIALRLIMKNPHWDIRLKGERDDSGIAEPRDVWWLEAVGANKPWGCLITNAMTRLVTVIVACAVVVILGYLAFLYGRHQNRTAKEREDMVYDLVENIIDLLKEQTTLNRDNPTVKPYLAINHIHDTLISPQDRQKKKGLWDRAVKFIKSKETRVREEVQQIHGEEFHVWRWLQTIDTPRTTKGKVWQGSALGGATKIKFQPTQFLKIRGMFDVFNEIGRHWPQLIEDAILEKLGDRHGVVHVSVDSESDENRVYVKFETNKRAGKAFEILNGAYFGGQCVNCKFMTAAKYHQKFPQAEYASECLKPSNALKLSLQSNIYPSLD